jgi:ATP-binding cassette, subfamily B (MDR/TAP), member 1
MNKYDDVKMNANVNMKSIDDIDDIDDIKSTTKIEPVPFKELFRFYKTEDIVMLLTGCVFAAIGGLCFPGINIAFRNMMDSTAASATSKDQTKNAVMFMEIVALTLGTSLFLAYGLVSWAASRNSRHVRQAYVESLLTQDVQFFDEAKAGELASYTAEKVNELQQGLAKKFAELVQAFFQMAGGFAVGFYFSWELALVILATTPLLGLATMTLVKTVSQFEKGVEAYKAADAVATESLTAIRVTNALNIQPIMAKRYDSHLGLAEKEAATRTWKAAFSGGSLFGTMFLMYSLGLWYGNKIVADSMDDALKKYPAPDELTDSSSISWGNHTVFAQPYCGMYEPSFIASGSQAYTQCMCKLEYPAGYESPNCGCGYKELSAISSLLGSSSDVCISGGTIVMVFFSVLFGGFALGQAGPAFEALAKARIAAAKIYRIIDRVPANGIDTRKPTGNELSLPIKGDIEFRNVHFAYGTLNRKVFSGINLKIDGGTVCALVGQSGCGKSTIARMLERFYDPQQGGCIMLDGVDIRSLNINSLRDAIGIVSQEPLLFEASIAENIAAGAISSVKSTISEEDIERAARVARAHEFIQNFPDGYNTIVGGKNAKLSGGQKQRIAIARAALRNPPVLILDEATSALDTENERLVQAALDALVSDGSRTTIVIAHRLTTVRNADKIVVLGKPGNDPSLGSEVMEEGTHDELMKLGPNGKYRSLVGLSKDYDIASKSSSSTMKKSSSKASFASLASAENTLIDGKGFSGGGGGKSDSYANLSELSKDDSKRKKKKSDQRYEVKTSRIWSYSKNEYPLVIFGCVVAIINGCIMPAVAFVFAEIMALFFNFDTDYMRERSEILALAMFGVAVAALLASGVQGGVFGIVGERLTTRLRSHAFRAMLRQDIPFFDNSENSVGALTQILSVETSKVRNMTGQSLGGFIQTIGALGFGLGLALSSSWKFGLCLLAAVPILSIGEMMNMKNLSDGGASAITDSTKKSSSVVSEAVQMIRDVQAFGLEKRIAGLYGNLLIEPSREERNESMRAGATFGISQAVTMGFYGYAFWLGGYFIERGDLSFIDFMKALWALGFCAAGAGQAAMFMGDKAAGGSAASRIFELIDRKPPIDTNPFLESGEARAIPLTSSQAKDGKIIENYKGSIEFQDVKFSYPTRDAPVLNGLSLSVKAGETIALIGTSGSGKSTAVQLLERFYDAVARKSLLTNNNTDKDEDSNKDELNSLVIPGDDCGRVLLDGVDIKDLDVMWLRAQIGLVEQEPVLFSGSVHDNIASGSPTSKATRDRVIEAAKIANAHEFIMNMPQGYDSDVGVGGALVSGGQKQCIAIARAIVHEPKILLLDEATSALDNESEKLVQSALDAVIANGKQRSTIVIAHRLSTIRNATRIYLLENESGSGSVVAESGSHDELMRKGGKYELLRNAYDDK